MWISPVWIASRGIEPLKESMHNKSLCECHEFSVWLLCHGFFFVSSQFFSMILHKLSSLCLVLYSIFIIMLVNITFWGMHLLWNSQCEYDKHFPAFIWFNFFLNVTKYDKENDSKRIDWNSPGIFVIACDQSGCWEQFHCQCDQGNSDEKWHWNRFGFHFSFCNNNMTSVEFFFRIRSLKNQFVPIQNGLELFSYSNHMRCKQQ